MYIITCACFIWMFYRKYFVQFEMHIAISIFEHYIHMMLMVMLKRRSKFGIMKFILK
jgi:hypothetical protein